MPSPKSLKVIFSAGTVSIADDGTVSTDDHGSVHVLPADEAAKFLTAGAARPADTE